MRYPPDMSDVRHLTIRTFGAGDPRGYFVMGGETVRMGESLAFFRTRVGGDEGFVTWWSKTSSPPHRPTRTASRFGWRMGRSGACRRLWKRKRNWDRGFTLRARSGLYYLIRLNRIPAVASMQESQAFESGNWRWVRE